MIHILSGWQSGIGKSVMIFSAEYVEFAVILAIFDTE